MRTTEGITKRGTRILLSIVLAVCGFSFAPISAEAVSSTDMAISDAQAAVSSSRYSLEEAQSRLDEITVEYNQLSSEINDMQARIDQLSNDVLAAQTAMLEGRAALSDTAVYEYRNSIVSTFLNVLLGSQSISELTANMSYIDQLMNHQADEIATQKRLKSELEEVAQQLSQQKADQEVKLSELDQKQSEAASVVSSVSAELAANSDRLAALQAQAAALKRQETHVAQEVNPEANTINRPDSSVQAPSGSPSSSSSSTTPVTTKPSSGSSSGGSGSSAGGEGWHTGLATAYGGSSDPWTPNPGVTATGAICNDSSFGVAVPMAWSNYRSYLGRTVEIKWNGQTVYAPVNDCGGMQGGRVSLDLQPGVFKAFGFSTCQAWGIRTVQYRFL